LQQAHWRSVGGNELEGAIGAVLEGEAMYFFSHAKVDTVLFADAMRGIMAMTDKVLRKAIKAKVEEHKSSVKK
jgi:hypothetical protein